MESPRPIDAIIAIHQGLRHEFARLPITVKAIADGDTDRAAVVGAHVLLMADLLAAHNVAEDSILAPVAVNRLPELAEGIATMEVEHAGLDAQLGDLRALAGAWVESPGHQERASLHTALIAFERSLLHDLAVEEQGVLMPLADVLTAEDVAAFGEASRARLTPDQVTMLIGLTVDGASPEYRLAFISDLPADVRAAFDATGNSVYTDYKAKLTDY